MKWYTSESEPSRDTGLSYIHVGDVQGFRTHGKPPRAPRAEVVDFLSKTTSKINIGNWRNPPATTEKLLLNSLAQQFAKPKSTYTPVDQDIEKMASRMDSFELTPSLLNPTIENLRWLVERAIRQLKLDSSPGYPMNKHYALNSQVLENEYSVVVNVAAERLYAMMHEDFSTLTDRQLLERGLRDPVRPFNKNEPHPERKWTLERYRLISGLSLIDQICERVLLSDFTFATKRRYPHLPTLIGIGFTDEMNTEIYELVLGTPGSKKSGDVSGWDSCVNPQMTIGFTRVVISKCLNATKQWELALHNWSNVTSRALYVLPSGKLIRPVNPGQVLSGSYVTTCWNSVMRATVAYKFSDEVFDAGDDAIEASSLTVEELIEAYASVNINLREVCTIEEGKFSFCSHTYSTKDGQVVASLDSYEKALYKFFCNDTVTDEIKHALFHELRHNEPKIVDSIQKTIDFAYPCYGVIKGKYIYCTKEILDKYGEQQIKEE